MVIARGWFRSFWLCTALIAVLSVVMGGCQGIVGFEDLPPAEEEDGGGAADDGSAVVDGAIADGRGLRDGGVPRDGSADGAADGDATVSADADAGIDSGVDSGVDAEADAGVDSGVDSGFDATVDSGADAGLDAAVDGGVDSGVDATVDGGVDSGFDATIDSGVDSGTDAGGPAGDGGHNVLVLQAGEFGGPGCGDGTGAEARFNRPEGLAVESSGNVLVADSYNRAIRRVAPDGVVSTFSRFYGSSGGCGYSRDFSHPGGIAIDTAGDVFVADTVAHSIVKTTPDGGVATLAGGSSSGTADGTGAAARFNQPNGVAVDSAGTVYVADTGNHTIRKVTSGGVVSTFAGLAGASGSADGTGAAARFNYPQGVAVDSAGTVYVADSDNHTIRTITAAGVVSTLAGSAGVSGGINGTGAAAQFNYPTGVAVDTAGNVFVADSSNTTIRRVTPAGVVTTFAGFRGYAGAVDGIGTAAKFSPMYGVAVDSSGNVFVADTYNDTIRKITSAQVVTTMAGNPPHTGTSDDAGAALFSGPVGLAIDSAENVFVADKDNSAIRQVSPGGVVSTCQLGGGLPFGVAVDSSGTLFVVIGSGSIRKITAGCVVSTLAGTDAAHGSVDGTGAAARFFSPRGIAVDSSGNVFVADTWNYTIRKITPAGVVSTFAGTAGAWGSADGTGAAARFSGPYGVAVDGAGNVFVADSGNSTIRMITPAGVVSTIAGTAGQSGHVDDVGIYARFAGPNGVAVDSAGNVFVADGDATVRKIDTGGNVTTIAGVPDQGAVRPGPLPASLNNVLGIAVTPTGNLVVTSENAVLDVIF